VLLALLASPLYVAISECEPTARFVTSKVAVPLLRLACPNVTDPSLKVTFPKTPFDGDTAPVSVTP